MPPMPWRRSSFRTPYFPIPWVWAMPASSPWSCRGVPLTEPEVAHVGLYEKDAREKGIEVETYTYKLDEVDRAILDGEDEGFARIHIQKGTDKIVGAHDRRGPRRRHDQRVFCCDEGRRRCEDDRWDDPSLSDASRGE